MGLILPIRASGFRIIQLDGTEIFALPGQGTMIGGHVVESILPVRITSVNPLIHESTIIEGHIRSRCGIQSMYKNNGILAVPLASRFGGLECTRRYSRSRLCRSRKG